MHLPSRILRCHGCDPRLSRCALSYCRDEQSTHARQTFYWPALTLPSSDIDECTNSTVCGPEASCTNTPGSFTCACNAGWAPTDRKEEPREASNVCIGQQGGENQSPRNLQRDTRPAASETSVCVCRQTLRNVWKS